MLKIATPQDFQAELQGLLAYCQAPQPSRQLLASKLRDLSERVAGLGVGRGTFTDKGLKIHHYRGSLKITDMANAGKRGKKVRVLTVWSNRPNDDETDALLEKAVEHLLHLDYDGVKRKLEDVQEQYGQGLKLDETILRGVDVEPEGTKITLGKKFPDGSSIEITASPHEFRVTDRHFFPTEKGGFHQDTMYWGNKKQDGIMFYGWLKDNLAAASNMTLDQLRDVWNKLGIRYDSH